MSTNYDIARDLREAVAMAEGLDRYVRGTELYGATGGGFFASSMPSLTVGALVMRLRRLHALSDQLDARQRDQLEAAQKEFDRVQKEWNVHFSGKIAKEALSRLDAMRTFFSECSKSNATCAQNYAPEALRRTIVEELRPVIEANQAPAEGLAEKLRSTDANLRAVVQPDQFIWSPLLQPVYPQAVYWWLYQRPPQS